MNDLKDQSVGTNTKQVQRKHNENDYIRELLDASYQGVKRLFVLAFRDRGGDDRVTADSHRRYFLPRVKTEN